VRAAPIGGKFCSPTQTCCHGHPSHHTYVALSVTPGYIVIDEAHAYRASSGLKCVRATRLLRLCHSYGAEPQFILCSATIANPGEQAQHLTSQPALVIQDDGSPQAAREFVLWNPPFVDALHTTRRSANVEATTLLVEMLQHGIRNITFTRARKVAELILLYTREILSKASNRACLW